MQQTPDEKPRARQRKNATPLSTTQKPAEDGPKLSGKRSSPDFFESILEGFRILVLLLIVSGAASWFVTGNSFFWGWKGAQWARGVDGVKVWWNGPKQFSTTELSRYNGEVESLPIYVGLNGTVYDVSAARSTYGPGGPYHFFAGRDAARAFVTGCFQDDLTDDLRGVEQMMIPYYSIVPDGSAAAAAAEKEWKAKQEKKRKNNSKGGAHHHQQSGRPQGGKPPVEAAGGTEAGDILYADQIDEERDLRLALENVAGTIEHWGSLLGGRTGDRPYFEVGSILYSDEEKRQRESRLPPTLCQPAVDSKPTVTVIARIKE